MEGRYLHSPDPRIRRWSAVAYAVASAVAGVVWTAAGGLDALRADRSLEGVAYLLPALLAWFVVAGTGLRIVRWRERTSRAEGEAS